MNLKCYLNKDAFDAVSNTISALRFPLAVMVIVLHCGINDMNYSVIGLADLNGNFPIYFKCACYHRTFASLSI